MSIVDHKGLIGEKVILICRTGKECVSVAVVLTSNYAIFTVAK